MNDLISRRQAIDALRKMQTYKLFSGDDMLLIDQAGAQTELMLLPSAQSEPKRGKWIYKTGLITAPTGYWECSECKEGRLLYEENFCPHCGADMRTAEQIVHDAIDNTPMAEDAYPGIKERLHKAVDDMREVTT